jgi:hypothetical protein
MKALKYWSLGRVVLTSVAWFIVSVAGLFYANVSGDFAVDAGAGIGAVSIELNPIVLAIPFVPPIMLMLVWLILRRSRAV